MNPTTGTDPDIPILHEDNHLLVIEKPVGVLSQEDRTGDPDVLTLCKSYLKKRYNKPGNVFLGLLHRLDRPVGGVMVLARTSRAASRISAQIREHLFEKRYLAVVHGKTSPNGVLVHHLEKQKPDRSGNPAKVRVTHREGKQTKRAELSFIRRSYDPERDLSLLQIQLITGRPHQIRVQFASEGHPLYGDRKYGTGGGPGQSPALHAGQVRFTHPVTGEPVSFSSPVPDIPPWSSFR